MIKVETPRITIGQLSDTIESNQMPVRRSTHVGNQPPLEMAIMAGLPPGVDVMMVDTIQGNDGYALPHRIMKRNEKINLLSNKKASGRVVGYCEAANPYDDGRTATLDQIHQYALDKLNLSNPPIAMMKFFNRYPHILGATIQACLETNELNRLVGEDGKIEEFAPGRAIEQIYSGGKTTGAMIPLNGMMAMDMLISNELGSDRTMHLCGPHMVEYVRDDHRMKIVSELFARACALMEIKAQNHIYRVVDSRGLAVVDALSQHELLETGMSINLEPYYSMPTGRAA